MVLGWTSEEPWKLVDKEKIIQGFKRERDVVIGSEREGSIHFSWESDDWMIWQGYV